MALVPLHLVVSVVLVDLQSDQVRVADTHSDHTMLPKLVRTPDVVENNRQSLVVALGKKSAEKLQVNAAVAVAAGKYHHSEMNVDVVVQDIVHNLVLPMYNLPDEPRGCTLPSFVPS